MPALAGTTMAPTMVGASDKRNVMPSKAWVELDCRIPPGTSEADVEAAVRTRLGEGLDYDLSWPEPRHPRQRLPARRGGGGRRSRRVARRRGRRRRAAAEPGHRVHRLSYLRLPLGTAAYGFSPFFTTPLAVLVAGYHNADERVHVDDLFASVRFHLHLAKALLS